MVLPLTETAMLVERGCGAEHLPTVLALDLCPAVGMHPLVAAQVGELCVGLVTHLTCSGHGDRHIPITHSTDIGPEQQVLSAIFHMKLIKVNQFIKTNQSMEWCPNPVLGDPQTVYIFAPSQTAHCLWAPEDRAEKHWAM